MAESSAPEEVAAAASERSPWAEGWIVHPAYDLVFFVLSPLLALAAGALVGAGLGTEPLWFTRDLASASTVFIGTFIMAHLVLVVVRSHLNPQIFRATPWRFTLVPLLLFVALLSSPLVQVVVAVVAIYWDVYHSSLQTFGLGRLYDQRVGNDASAGRLLDWGLNLLLYAGPILAGASLMDHMDRWPLFAEHGLEALAATPGFVEGAAPWIRWAVLVGAGCYLAIYLLGTLHLAQRGHRVSPQKVLLFTTTGLVCLWAWGFNAFGQAFFIANFFHALQYFAIIWWAEGDRLTARLRAQPGRHTRRLALLVLVLGAGSYGLWADQLAGREGLPYAVILTVSIMHFWWDGFIWSVRKGQV